MSTETETPKVISQCMGFVHSYLPNIRLFENKTPINLEDASIVYIQLNSQARDGGKISSGFNRNYYPCKVVSEKGEKYLETLVETPAHPAGYGNWLKPGERKELNKNPVFIRKSQKQ